MKYKVQSEFLVNMLLIISNVTHRWDAAHRWLWSATGWCRPTGKAAKEFTTNVKLDWDSSKIQSVKRLSYFLSMVHYHVAPSCFHPSISNNVVSTSWCSDTFSLPLHHVLRKTPFGVWHAEGFKYTVKISFWHQFKAKTPYEEASQGDGWDGGEDLKQERLLWVASEQHLWCRDGESLTNEPFAKPILYSYPDVIQ